MAVDGCDGFVPTQTCLGEAQNTGCRGEGAGGSWAPRARGILLQSSSAVLAYLWQQANTHISGNAPRAYSKQRGHLPAPLLGAV